MITMSLKTTSADVLSYGERFTDPLTALAAILRCELRGDLQNLPASVFSFARQDQKEGAPRHIDNAFRQMVILDHSGDVQIFDRDHIKLPDDPKSGLMVKVRPLADNLLMASGQKLYGFPPALRSLFASGYFALSGLQLRLSRAEKLRILNLLAGREGSITPNAHIDPDLFAGLRKEPGLILFDRKYREPSVRFSLNRASLNLTLNRSMLDDSDMSDLGEIKAIASDRKGRLHLREGERVESGLALESRMAGSLTGLTTAKESVKGFPEATESILENLRIDSRNVFSNVLDLRQLNRLSVVIDRHSIRFPRIAALLKSGVVQLTASVKPLLKCASNARRWLNPELVRLHKRILHKALGGIKYFINERDNLAGARCEIHLPAKAGSPLSLCL